MPAPLRLFLETQHWEELRLLPSGEIAGLQRMLFTWALATGIDATGYRVRWCYESREEASVALKHWDGTGDPLGNWIVQKPGDRPNPRRTR